MSFYFFNPIYLVDVMIGNVPSKLEKYIIKMMYHFLLLHCVKNANVTGRQHNPM